jgi:type VI protein secretion system component VasA
VPVRVLNVTAPTMPLYPRQTTFHWRVMSHLGSNQHDGQSGGPAGNAGAL